MKLQLDTDNKTIKLESEVVLSKLVETLSKLLPNGEWKKFTLQTNTTIVGWSSPIVIHDHNPLPYWQPWYQTRPYTVMSTNGGGNLVGSNKQNANYSVKANAASGLSLKSGVFNVEV